jgi:UDP-GlcNAc:undecaprenyl-phosphate GlcNAc-1-phosphate transferase
LYSLAFLMGLSAVFAWLLTPAVRNHCRTCGWLDEPDHRKRHTTAVPRLGGLAIMLAYGASLVLFATLPLSASLVVRPHWEQILTLVPAVTLVLFMGLVDDLRGLLPITKILAEVAAALTVYSAGVRIAGGEWWSMPLTVLWLVGTTNAVNLIDGVDGLAAGVSLFATLTMFAAALINGNILLAIVTAPLAGCLLGFLRYNFEPASIFLGDSGSLTIGFLLGCFGLIWGYKSATAVGMVAPMMLLTLPFLDVGLAIGRRFLSMQPIFGADHGHIHHRLLARGLRPRHVALICYFGCGIAGIVSLWASQSGPQLAAFLVIAFAALVWIAVSHLGFTEFRSARRSLLGNRWRQIVRDGIIVDRMKSGLASAQSAEDYWGHLHTASEMLGLGRVHLQVDGRVWSSDGDQHPAGWETRVPLRGDDYVTFQGVSPDPDTAHALIPLALALRDAPMPPSARKSSPAPRESVDDLDRRAGTKPH